MKLRRPHCLVPLLGLGTAGLCALISLAPRHDNVLSDRDPVAASRSAASSVSTDAPAMPQPYVKIFSVATTHNTQLDTCVDFIVEIAPPQGVDATWTPQPPSDLRQKLAKLGRALDRPCQEQFAERFALATCVTTAKREDQTLRLVERHYDYSTVGVDDTRLEDCLRLGGDWQAVAKNSPEFLHAKRTAIMQDLEAMAQGT